MAQLISDLNARLSTLKAGLGAGSDQATVEKELTAVKGDWSVALPRLKATLPPESMKRVELAHSLAEWSGDNAPVVSALSKIPGIASLRDVALNMSTDKLASLVDPQSVPDGTPGASDDQKKKNFAVALNRKLFAAEPTAMLHRMVASAEIPIADPAVRDGVTTFLANQPDFNIRTTSLYAALAKPDALKGIAEEQFPATVDHLKHLQRVQALTTAPEAIPTLMKANLSSAFHIAEMPEAAFVNAYGTDLGQETARTIYSNAVNVRVRNEQALMQLREISRGSGIAAIDRESTGVSRLDAIKQVLVKENVPLDLESLFGSQDYCECGECNTVYSPAAYFVELLQYLRSNNTKANDPKGYAGTPLEMLFRRRPDLRCLELTCANTNTVLPYVDLANEVMESFVVHRAAYHADGHTPKQATLDVWNVADETSGELLAEPQHTNYQAYAVLKNAVYPFSLPYHQPIDAIRTFLGFLGTSRFELQDTFRAAHDPSLAAVPAAQQAALDALHGAALDRAGDAEFLGMTQEEYVILTREAFWAKAYFELTQNKTFTDAEYQAQIGVKDTPAYYGYAGANAAAEMLSTDESAATGLTFVKGQLLPRTGLAYVDLVEVLKTRFINPNYPDGEALTALESIPFSYAFLMRLVDQKATDRAQRFARLIAALEWWQDQGQKPDPCHPKTPDCQRCKIDWRGWVFCYFDRVGKLIVLASGDQSTLSVSGDLYEGRGDSGLGRIDPDGRIYDLKGSIIGVVGPDASIAWSAGTQVIAGSAYVLQDDEVVGRIADSKLYQADYGGERWSPATWLPPKDSCDLSTVRLRHLDGTPVTVEEYDRIQRFVRLWRKLGWTIAETDLALVGVGVEGTPAAGSPPGPTAPPPTGITFGDFTDDGSDVTPPEPQDGGCCGDGEPTPFDCPDPPEVKGAVTPEFMHQVADVRRLLDRTGLPLDRLLAFWSNIDTAGSQSLYARLFLTHNVVGIDTVFKPDRHGNYLTQPAARSAHVPVLMAALKMKADDIAAIVAFRALPDDLTLGAVSTLYRHALLARLIHARIVDLPQIIALLGDPFTSAQATLDFLDAWQSMTDAGFTFRQLDYAIADLDDAVHPLAPAQKTILKVTKTLYDGLQDIDRTHVDIASQQEATSDVVRAKAGLVFEPAVVDQIMGLLEGTSVWKTYAPRALTPTIPDSLAGRLKYVDATDPAPALASVQLTGILTAADQTIAKGLSGDPKWSKAIDRASGQPGHFFDDVLFGALADAQGKTDTIKAELLAADFTSATDSSAPAKRFQFLGAFLPFLRRRLAHRLIGDTMAGLVGLSSEVTHALLSEILVVPSSGDKAIDALTKIKDEPATPPDPWKGFLLPASDDTYTFIIESDTAPAALTLDGQARAFQDHRDDVAALWWTDPIKLKAGSLHSLQLSGAPIGQLQWKTATTPRTQIPAGALLADYSTKGTSAVFRILLRVAILANGFNLSADEVRYWQQPAAGAFDWNHPSLAGWKRLRAYAVLRDTLPKSQSSLLELFGWSGRADSQLAELADRIAAVTGWSPDRITSLIAKDHFDLGQLSSFGDERNLLKLQAALAVADKIGAGIDRLFAWAVPGSKFSPCHQIAESIRLSIRARYDAESWEQAAQPLFDTLRENQKEALIAFLLQSSDLIDWGVRDADGLFEFFLIDVQMQPCMQTSRIKQAISTAQLFIQRCFLGLEASRGVAQDALDADRWKWMSKFRVWEANRKVFLYPENWIDPSLRDDKSPFYKELESELLQKDINAQTVEDALQSYLFKLDEVANLKVVGLFDDEDAARLHVFARTRNVPYLFFYRYFDYDQQSWHPWEKVQVDIPSYDYEKAPGQDIDNGTYLIPVVWNSRLLLFFPQFMKKTTPAEIKIKEGDGPERDRTTRETADSPPADGAPSEYWEIKLAWSELRNGKWTQKQVSQEAVHDYDTASAAITVNNVSTITRRWLLPPTRDYQFVPRSSGSSSDVIIDVNRADSARGAFHFAGTHLSKGTPGAAHTQAISGGTDFHYEAGVIHSLQASGSASPDIVDPPAFTDHVTYTLIDSPSYVGNRFFHGFTHQLLGALAKGDSADLFAYYLDRYLSTGGDDKDEMYGAADDKFNELSRTYSLYNWEVGFHVPAALAGKLLSGSQFDQALAIYHYVFDPLATGVAGEAKPYWRFPPFKDIKADREMQSLLRGLQPGKSNKSITDWRDNPFNPHLVARSRPSAYMKWIVMQYLETLIAYGDYYFRQNTLETIPYAIQCYVMASHLFGPRGQKIPRRGTIRPETYLSLLDRWDAFGNAMVELELVFPFSNQTSKPMIGNGKVPLANVFGFATSLYFCIPDNPNLQSIRDTIDDRLFKIRHCEDIDGVFRQLPLFEPPIDPALLVAAAAAGLSIDSVLNDLNAPMPNYRFQYLLQKALELCSELRALGNNFLTTKEKRDAEALGRLRAQHDTAIQTLIMEVRKNQLEEANRSLAALEQNRKGPVSRMQYYLKLVGEDLAKVPDGDTDFAELANQIEQPIDDSGMKLIGYEKEDLDKTSQAADKQVDVGRMESIASILHAIPTIGAFATPIGVGANFTIGGSNFGNMLQGIARWLQTDANKMSFDGSNAGKKAGFLRQLQDRVQQANAAGYEVKSIDKQILAQQIRIAIAEQEITNQQKQIDSAEEVEDFLRTKYTNDDLYGWLESSLRSLHYQVYTLAYDLGKRAEKTFRFERGLFSTNFIQFGYWDAAHDGLLAGERLYVGLKQLEAAHQEKRPWDFEVTKAVSLRQIAPLALFELRESGSCTFELPEILFDMDYPGHYQRRIKTVALTIPCVVGPYTSLNCTLRLLDHSFRNSALAQSASDYPRTTDEDDARFTSTSVPITAIAVSTGQNDSGVFDLSFHDERYMPFEGAGAISKWRIELPADFRQFDYDTISDVVMHLRYTAVDGGDKLKGVAASGVQTYVKSVEDLSRDEGLFAAFDLIHDFPNEWYRANNPPAGATTRALLLGSLTDRLPIFARRPKPDQITAIDAWVIGPSTPALSLVTPDGGEVPLAAGVPYGPGSTMSLFTAEGIATSMNGWQIKLGDLTTKVEKLWLAVRYQLPSK